MKKNPVYFIWYRLVIGQDVKYLTSEMTFVDLFKRAETKEEIESINGLAHANLVRHYGGEGLTVDITGMMYARSQDAPKIKPAKNVGKANNTKSVTRKSGSKR